MTKSKSQLRAEAVERLKDCRYHTLADYVRAMLGWGHEPHFEDSRDALIDLLTDECGPCYSCAKLAERSDKRAVAVKRLRKMQHVDDYGDWIEAIAEVVKGTDKSNIGDYGMWESLIDLLTDECGPCYSCAKLAELRAENSALRAANDMKATESDVRTLGVDANDANVDTREKLEADIRKYRNEHCETNGRVAEWLNRQAAITKREREQHWLEIVGASANCNLELTNQIAELREDVAERDDVIAVLKAENAELQSRHCEWSDPNSLGDGCMLRKDKRVDELTAERDELREKLSAALGYALETPELVDMNGEVVG